MENNSNVTLKKGIARKRIIRSLYYNGTLSNLEIGRQLFMTPPSVNLLLKGLIDEGIVGITGHGSSKGGRKPRMYGLVKDFAYVVAVDMDQYYTRLAIFNLHNENITPPKVIPLKLDNEKQTFDTLITEIQELIRSSKIERSKFLGVGLSMPGLVNTDLGVNYTFLNFGSSRSLQLLIEEKLHIPVYIENDASVLALGESKFGLAKGVSNALVIKMNWGVGLGLILNGSLYRGSAGMAGEFSHIPTVDNGIICSCGKQGCLETETSAIVLAKLAKEGIREGKLSTLKNMVNEDLEKIDSSMVVKAASMGDQYSVQILSLVGFNLGKGIAILIHLFNPELIVLGGSMAKANQYLMVPIQQALNKYCIPRIHDVTHIGVSRLDDRGGLIGAVVLVMENVFDENSK